MSSLDRLADELRAAGGLLAAAVVEPVGEPLYRGGPRDAESGADLELVVEAAREGYLLHYGTPRLVSDSDSDLALLAGDRLYAFGLERLAAAGDLTSVRALADTIALSAQAQAAGDSGLAEAVWEAGACEIGHGGSPELDGAKVAVRAGQTGAEERLRAAARHVNGQIS